MVCKELKDALTFSLLTCKIHTSNRTPTQPTIFSVVCGTETVVSTKAMSHLARLALASKFSELHDRIYNVDPGGEDKCRKLIALQSEAN